MFYVMASGGLFTSQFTVPINYVVTFWTQLLEYCHMIHIQVIDF